MALVLVLGPISLCIKAYVITIVFFSICFRTLIKGDKQAGFSIFWPDDGLDTGPILLQKTTDVDDDETVDSLYNRFLYPEGVTAMVSGAV